MVSTFPCLQKQFRPDYSLMNCMQPLVSIIVACKKVDGYAKECVEHCKLLDYGDFEVLLLPDDASENVDGVRVISTGCVTPGKKRNIGVANAEGEFCAFIDSDAYPSKDWLRNAMKYFNDSMVSGVGGPGLTPEHDSFMQRASGYVLSSFMVGSISSRYKAERVYESDDIHSCNFIARKTVLKEVGGWNERYWPGEDTLICLAMKKLGKKLVEASDVVVYHHRRPLFAPHLKQVSRFGSHRGFFARRFRANSFRLTYFMPSLLVFSLFVGVFASFIYSFFLNTLLLAGAVYLVLSLIAAAFEVEEAKLLLPVWLGIMVTHVIYGLSFLVGLMKRDLRR
jgi:cellulose synthase/poly-beta-1,6-N-acetylglucosamine synthase-like glycosyltransferase